MEESDAYLMILDQRQERCFREAGKSKGMGVPSGRR